MLAYPLSRPWTARSSYSGAIRACIYKSFNPSSITQRLSSPFSIQSNNKSNKRFFFSKPASTMADHLYISETPSEVKNAKGLHLLTMNTPNGQAVQILLEELKDVYGTQWTTTLIDIMTNEQKKEWFLRLDPNGMLLLKNLQIPLCKCLQTAIQTSHQK